MWTLSKVRQTHNWCNEKFDQLPVTNLPKIGHDFDEKNKVGDDDDDDDDDDDRDARWKMKLVWLTRARWVPVEPN